jgi:TrmH family RNA methyltransferase
VYTPRTPRVVAARRLSRRREREEAGRFLVEGPPAIGEALTTPGAVVELFVTVPALDRHPELISATREQGVRVSPVTEEALAGLAGTVHPQGLVAVCRRTDVELPVALGRRPRLAAVLVDIRDPGNAGTVLRTADAAGAGAVVFAGAAVDPYNDKCVRASAGSLFHVDVVVARSAAPALAALRQAGLTVLAADVHGDEDLDELADARVRVPIHGRAESLNLAAAAAVCLYSSARAHRSKEQSQ